MLKPGNFAALNRGLEKLQGHRGFPEFLGRLARSPMAEVRGVQQGI
jgi:hypothetical protein